MEGVFEFVMEWVFEFVEGLGEDYWEIVVDFGVVEV